MSKPTAVLVSELTHQYEGASAHPILNKLSLQLDTGKTLALVGSSGSGKSTLLNIIGGLEPVQSGSVYVFGESLNTASESIRTQLRRTTLGFVYQAFNLIPTLSVTDNVRLPLALAGVQRSIQNDRIDKILDTVGLSHRAEAFPDALSGGEQQRVAIARAVVHEPQLLLADEPTGNLDAKTGQRVMDLLQQLVAEQNTTLLMVTHSQTVASLCDRVLTIHDGQLNESDVTGSSSTW